MGSKFIFWEDVWLGSSSLAIQYWNSYSTINEHNKTITKLWDGTDLNAHLGGVWI
jgi:hypothetical protein